MPVGAPPGVSGGEREHCRCIELTGWHSLCSAGSVPRVRHRGTGTAQSSGSFSAPQKQHNDSTRTRGSAAAGQGRLPELLTLTAQAVPDISRQTFITFRP